jgi:hypothetical protein
MSHDAIPSDILRSLSILAEQPLKITARFLSPTKFLLEIPFGLDQRLLWQLSYSRVGGQHMPDLLFGDGTADFLPLQSPAVASCLERWNSDNTQLASLMEAVLDR